MAKRSRRKTAKALEKRAKARTEAEETLIGSKWDALSSDDDGGNHEVIPEADENQDYESIPRRFKIQDEGVERLPVKTRSGELVRVVDQNGRKNESSESEADEESASESQTEEFEDEEVPEEEDTRISEYDQIRSAKELIADVAERLNEDPEEYIGRLRELRELIDRTKLFKVKQLAVLSLVPIFKDLIPGYRIRPLTETEKAEKKVSREVKKLRTFEETLLSNYRAYIDILKDYAKKGKGTEEGSVRYTLASSSIAAVCELLTSIPHFNFRNDLLDIILEKLSMNKADKSFQKCIVTIDEIFRADDEGQVSFDVVRLLTKMIKAKHYKVNPAILNSLLYLRLLTELSAKGDQERIDRQVESFKIKKKDRVHLSKSERKARKERKAIEQEIMRAETTVSSEERERLQGETLKLIFILYFNILKGRSQRLMGVTLEGLAKFAHLINAEFFGDLLVVLRELVQERQQTLGQVGHSVEFKETTTREALLCIVTAFALLQGQVGESMNIDLSFFVSHFYSTLYSLALNPDIEFSNKTLRLDDPLATNNSDNSLHTKNNVNISTEMEMVIRIFESIFFVQKSVSKLKVQAFTKRLSISSLHFPEKSTIAALKILDKLSKKFSVVNELYSMEDRVANGLYRMDVDIPEHSNPEAATIWETAILENHYSPGVTFAVKSILGNVRSRK